MNVSNAKQTSGDRYFAKTPFTARVSESLRSLFVSVLTDFISGGCVAKKYSWLRNKKDAEEEEKQTKKKKNSWVEDTDCFRRPSSFPFL